VRDNDKAYSTSPALDDTCRRAADKIAGAAANENLLRAVKAVATCVSEAREAQDASRSDARARLDSLSHHAEQIAAILEDLRLSPFLATLKSGHLNKVPLSALRMRELADDARFCRENIPGGGGATSLRDALGAARGRQICAVAVYRLWQIVRGRPPSKNSGNAASACDLIWQAASSQEDGNAFDGWERYLREVREATKRGFADDRLWLAWMSVSDILRDADLVPSEDGQKTVGGAYSDDGEMVDPGDAGDAIGQK
jgi:hypothetical protein